MAKNNNVYYEAMRKREEAMAKKRKKTAALIIGGIIVLTAIIITSVLVVKKLNKDDENANNNETYGAMSEIPNEINKYKVEEFSETSEESKYVIIKVKNYGDIVCELRGDIAPISVKNFKKLVSDKFYDGLTFHRIISGFMIQGGGYKEDGTLTKSDAIKGEFSANGVKNDLHHARGVLSMARTSVMDSASSQFFIMHEDADYLDGQYAAFGYVVAGLDVVDKIASVSTNSSDAPLEKIVIESVRFANKK